MLEHGGNLREAARHYGRGDWVDLSTGINPHGYPAPAPSGAAWHRLPEPDPALLAAARAYYRARLLLPVAGTQAAIQALPRLRPPSRVAVSAPSYAEHAYHWGLHGHTRRQVAYAKLQAAIDDSDVVVVVNPNNPTGETIAPERLLDWAARLHARGGWLVVDEAFIDLSPECSLAAHAHLPGLIVLRSFGKFFAMAGARLGFVLAEPELLAALSKELGPWPIAGPTRYIGASLLADHAGQRRQRERLLADTQRLAQLLTANGLAPVGGCGLFQWVVSDDSERLYGSFARRGILLRRFQYPPSLRFGLPPDEAGWSRLADALAEYREADQ